MVSRLDTVKSIAEPLSYNEEKVTQGKAELIHSANFLQDKHSLTYQDKLEWFQRQNELNTRAKTKMLHATLNFSPRETFSDNQLSTIVDRYMTGLHMEDQPYLVYRHNDAAHPHVHIVASLIQPDGSRIDTHNIGTRLSEPTRKAIEQEFRLIPGGRPRQAKIVSPEELRKIIPGSDIPVSETIDKIVASVRRHYNFSTLNEYNAILRTYNLTAETGSPGSKTHRHNGIYYVALDDSGNRISPPIMASQLSSRPTMTRLQEKFHHPDTDYLSHLVSIRQRIDWALEQKPETLRRFVSQLQRDGIEIVASPANGRNTHDQVYVDFRTRTAVSGETLGPDYTSEAITHAIGHSRKSTRQTRQITDKQSETRYNSNVPQVLSAVLKTSTGDPDSDELGQHQHLGARRKL